MTTLVENGRQHKIISASKVQHIECECGYTGYTHTGDCPNCHATSMLPASHADALAEHRSTVETSKSPKEIEKSLANYHTVTSQGGGAV